MQPPHDTQQFPAFDPSRSPAGPAAGYAPARRRRGLGLRLGIGVGVLVLLLAVAAVGGELGLRGSVTDRIQREATASLGSEASVDLGSGLVLPSMLTDRLSEVHITAPGSAPAPGSSGGEVAPAVDITAHGVSTGGETSHVDSLDGTVHVTDAQMTAAASQQSGGGGAGGMLGGFLQVQSVTSDPATGTLKADVGLAQATVRPVLENGKVDLKPEKASFLGIELPSSLLGGTVSMMDQATSKLPRGVRVTGVKVVPGGMDLTVSGTDVTLVRK